MPVSNEQNCENIFKHYVIMRKNTEKRRDVGYIFNEQKLKKETHA